MLGRSGWQPPRTVSIAFLKYSVLPNHFSDWGSETHAVTLRFANYRAVDLWCSWTGEMSWHIQVSTFFFLHHHHIYKVCTQLGSKMQLISPSIKYFNSVKTQQSDHAKVSFPLSCLCLIGSRWIWGFQLSFTGIIHHIAPACEEQVIIQGWSYNFFFTSIKLRLRANYVKNPWIKIVHII